MTVERTGLSRGFTARAYEEGDLAAVRALHAVAFRALAAGHHDEAQIAAHEALIRDPDYVAGCARIMVRANVSAAPRYARIGYAAASDGVMATPTGIDLPVVFMELPQSR